MKRILACRKLVLNFYFLAREFPELVDEIIKRVKLGKRIVGRSIRSAINLIEMG
ncbi:MAG: hypothetical protein ACTSRP_16035 [Candidatus Helarchaeota archaeon]